MSYGGFTQQWCERGHQFHTPLDRKQLRTCPQCSAPIVFNHTVDKTNGYMDDKIETECIKGSWIGSRYRVPTEADVAAAKQRRKLAEARAGERRRGNR